MKAEEVVDTLSGLVEACPSGQQEFHQAGAQAHSSTLRSFFSQAAHDFGCAATHLESLRLQYGGRALNAAGPVEARSLESGARGDATHQPTGGSLGSAMASASDGATSAEPALADASDGAMLGGVCAFGQAPWVARSREALSSGGSTSPACRVVQCQLDAAERWQREIQHIGWRRALAA